MNYFGLTLTALIPAIALCIYIYSKDRVEKEPIWLLLLLFGVGGVAFIPAILCEDLLISLFDKAFAGHMIVGLTGIEGFTSEGMHIAHSAACGFVAIALIEEAVKWLLLFFITRKNKNFNHLFDGVIYSVFVSLGFAVVENVRFGFINGWGTFILHTVTSLPAHMIFGVIMGFFYTMWNTYHIAAVSEKAMAKSGAIKIAKPIRSGIWLVGSLAVPILTHGFYSFIQYFTSDIIEDIFYIFIALMYIACLIVVNRLSRGDTHEDSVAQSLIMRKYPSLKEADVTIIPDGDEGGITNG